MSEKEIRTVNGKIYHVRESGGKFLVSKPGWMGAKSVGSTRSMADALALIESDAHEKVKHIG